MKKYERTAYKTVQGQSNEVEAQSNFSQIHPTKSIKRKKTQYIAIRKNMMIRKMKTSLKYKKIFNSSQLTDGKTYIK